jgi:hypothetical protein
LCGWLQINRETRIKSSLVLRLVDSTWITGFPNTSIFIADHFNSALVGKVSYAGSSVSTVIFVEAELEHRFYDIQEELELLVFFVRAEQRMKFW